MLMRTEIRVAVCTARMSDDIMRQLWDAMQRTCIINCLLDRRAADTA